MGIDLPTLSGPASSTEVPDRRRSSPPVSAETRILILAPLVNDGKLTAEFLERAGQSAVVCLNAAGICAEGQVGCGALLIAEEAIDHESAELLHTFIAQQPSWSDVPIAVITSGGDVPWQRRRLLDTFGPGSNVTLLERPFHPNTLISTMEAALRSRNRQYQVRSLLEQARESARNLEFVLRAGGLGAWTLDLGNLELACSETCKANFGIRADESLTYEYLRLLVHPEDRETWKQSIEVAVKDGTEFFSEYRIFTPSGEVRWIQVRGTVAYDAESKPVQMTGVTQNITQRKSAEQALAQQAAALREADRRKDEFLAMLAHELRNPLSGIGNAVALLKEKLGASEIDRDGDNVDSSAWATSVIERQNRQLARLVDDLLDVSRITRGKIELRRDVIDVGRCLENACDAVAPLIAQRGHTLLCSIPPGKLWVNADPTRIEQIGVNLLANAARYTENHGHIRLEARVEEKANTGTSEVVIEVRDSGIGIAPSKIPAMFELFAQGERSKARSEGGLGIGLTVVRALSEMHGGSVSASSDGLGKGSTFTVRLPLVESSLRDKVRSADTKGSEDGQGMKVLVVDDNVDSAMGLGRLLSRRGYSIRLAHEGLAAIEIAREFVPEVVLLDIGLPGIDGYEVARRLRQMPGSALAFIVAVSGYGQSEDRRRSREAGFDEHLTKPVDFDHVRQLLNTRH